MRLPVLWAALGCADPPVEGPPDVVVITVDTLRVDRLGYMGHAGAHTPTIDALAASGFVFREATTPFPRTTPALGSLQTGLRPTHHGSREVGEPVTAEGRLAAWLAEAGWQTGAASANAVAGPDQALDVGFAEYLVDNDTPAPDLTADVLRMARRLARDRPAYLWVHYADPHFPYLPHPSGPLQPEAARCRSVFERAAAGKMRRVELYSNRRGMAAEIVEQCRELYDAEVAVVDAAVDELLTGLDRIRRRPRLVVFSADHGENQGEDGLFFEHGPSVHDVDVLVPLVFAGPGVQSGVDAGVARLEDVAPTVLELLGLPARPDLDGISLVPRIRGDAAAEPTVAPIEAGSALQVRLFGWPVSGRDDHWCLNEGPLSWCMWTPAGDGPPQAGLYDHTKDPGLKRDLSARLPDVARRLAAASVGLDPERTRHRRIRTADRSLVATPTPEGWTVTVDDAPVAEGDPLLGQLEVLEAEIRAADQAPGGAPLGDDTEEALRALGYVE